MRWLPADTIVLQLPWFMEQPVGKITQKNRRLSGGESSQQIQSNVWITMPSRSFGSNQVDFGGMMSPASATAINSPIEVG